MRWSQVLGGTGVIETHFALIPTVRAAGDTVVLIDSGAAPHPELFDGLERLGLRVGAVLCTHLHPDHIANNRALIDRWGTEIYASAAEIRDVGPRYDFLRSDPLEQKWMPTEPDYTILPFPEVAGTVTVCGARFELLPTPGHVAGHLAIVTPDGVCCLGDALLSADQLRAARLPYIEDDVDQAMESMAALARTGYPAYIAAHRAVLSPDALPALADANIREELKLYGLLRGLLTTTGPMELEAAVTAFMKAAGVEREVMLRRGSMRLSARTRLSALARAGEFRIEDGYIAPV